MPARSPMKVLAVTSRAKDHLKMTAAAKPMLEKMAADNHFTIDNTQAGVKTVLNAGAGKDLVDVKAVSGHTFVNLGAVRMQSGFPHRIMQRELRDIEHPRVAIERAH
jgi:hypothetical protein